MELPALKCHDPVIRVLTWNIHKGVGWDFRHDLNRIVETVRRHRPDIIALQEVDSRRSRSGVSPFSHLQQALGEHCVEARAVTAPDGDYGHVVISRWPLSNPVLHDISVDRREPRRVIEATVDTEHGPLHLVAVHLGLAFGERRQQVDTLARLARAAARPSVMMGDFNDWIWRGRVNAALIRELPGRTWHRTFPSLLPLIRLDRIYCSPGAALVRSWTDLEARMASDHLPVVAEIAMQR